MEGHNLEIWRGIPALTSTLRAWASLLGGFVTGSLPCCVGLLLKCSESARRSGIEVALSTPNPDRSSVLQSEIVCRDKWEGKVQRMILVRIEPQRPNTSYHGRKSSRFLLFHVCVQRHVNAADFISPMDRDFRSGTKTRGRKGNPERLVSSGNPFLWGGGAEAEGNTSECTKKKRKSLTPLEFRG